LASLLSLAETDASTGKPKQARQGKQKNVAGIHVCPIICAQAAACKVDHQPKSKAKSNQLLSLPFKTFVASLK